MMELRWGAKSTGRAVLLAGAAWLALACTAQAQQPLVTIPAAPTPSPAVDDGLGDTGYYLESDLLIRDDANQKMIARGEVEARYQGRTLRADEVVYDTKTDVVTAHGHVTLINADGTAQFADDMTMDKDLKAGFARGFSARLDKNIKIAADTAIRRSDTIQELNQAIYTPCEVCAEKPKPTWSIEADKVVQDKKRHLVYYHGATIRMFGAPLLYLPVFWHPDPQTQRSSGFLTPKLAVSKRRGVSYQQPYLFAISPSQDLVLTPQINAKVNPFLNAQYRKRFYSGAIEVRAGGTYDKDFDNHGDRFGEATTKSYILARGLFDIDRKWKWGFTAERASDALIFDDYDINDVYQQRGQFTGDDHRLMSQVYATRQDKRSYFSASMVSVQGLRVVAVDTTTGLASKFENSGAFPLIGPLIEARWEPESHILGGRLRLQGSGVMLNRSESQFGEAPYSYLDYKGKDGVDSTRGTLQGDWRANLVLGPGLRVEPFAQARGDVYKVSDVFLPVSALTAGDTANINSSRALGVVGVDLSLPLYRPLKNGGSIVLEPLVQLATGSDSSRVPIIVARGPATSAYPEGVPIYFNEDSTNFELDETNLFDVNKSPGFDLYEGGTRMNVGGRATIKLGDGRGGSVLVGRSLRTKVDPLMPTRAGLDQKASDWIVAATVTPIRGVNAFTRARFDNDNGKLNRIEAGLDASVSRGFGSVRYLRDNKDTSGFRQENLDFTADYKIRENWGVTALGRLSYQDGRALPVDPVTGLTRKGEWSWTRRDLGVYYKDDCIRVDVIYQNEDRYTQTTSGLRLRADESIVLRLTLATLGDTLYSD
ncbi:LPS-assembly protein LptD [Caulobacter sp. Root655]|uniref:LPS-assembly protein LptD n=1 Tax=Caulobacter sp. Root655 TaxID=1736578 RepID=UPI000ACB1BA8|nr:LPS-assembly protein LptD [Caulobacter sp. Root655]